jgi:outer membrane lipoprotein-sorting protein
MAPSARRRTLRWSAPFATAAVIALIVAVPGLSSASTPALAAVTPAQLIAKIEQTKVKNLSGSLNLTPNLGIPNLSALSNAAAGGGHGSSGFSPADLLSGTHQALVWFAGPDKTRVALLQSLAETDVVHNGHDIWLWDSTTKKVTHYTLAADTIPSAGTKETPAAGPAEAIETPQQMADHLLAQITPSTSVSVGGTVTVAKQTAYQLVLAPHSAASTIDHAVIAVDSVTGLPLQVEIFAKGQKAAAVKLGFGTIAYSTPAASKFNFTAPPGSTVTSKTISASSPASSADKPADKSTTPAADAGASQTVTVGQDWTSVAIMKNVQIPTQLDQYLKAATSVMNGQAKLLQTSLVNVLILNDGRVAVGAVNASTLEAAVAAAP